MSPPVSLGSCIGVTVLGCLRAPGSLGHVWLPLQTPHTIPLAVGGTLRTSPNVEVASGPFSFTSSHV